MRDKNKSKYKVYNEIKNKVFKNIKTENWPKNNYVRTNLGRDIGT